MATPSWAYAAGFSALAACSARPTAMQAPAAPEAGIEAGTLDATPDTGDADAEASFCSGPTEGGALSAPEAVVSGEPNLDGLALSSAGLVWLEDAWGVPGVWLASSPPRLLFDAQTSPLSVGLVGGFGAAANLFVMSYCHKGCYNSGSQTLAFDIAAGQPYRTFNSSLGEVAVDQRRIYGLAGEVGCLPLVPGGCGYVGKEWASGIAIDDANLYALLLGANFEADGAYTVRVKQKGSKSAPSILASGVDPEPSYVLNWRDIFTMAAHGGNVAWVEPHKTLDVVYGILHGAAPRILVSEPDHVAGPHIGINSEASLRTIALDDQYVYWATETGKVKRRRLCGGPVEVLATNQEYPMALGVDDSAIYWISRGSDLAHPVGNIMRIRKLDAPDAGIDAASDGGAEAASDASLDATPD